jgi:hypothetical protein
MTTQTKTFIELADIIGLQLTCKQCGCSLAMETAKDNGTVNNLLADNNTVLTKCPTCGHAWTENVNLRTFDSDIKELFRKLRDLKKAEPKFGCAITLEIAESAEPE